MTEMNRRGFLGRAAGSAAALSALSYARAAGQPNEKIVLGVMGVRGRGLGLVKGFSGFENVDLTYLCDPDENVIAPALKESEKRQKKTPKVEKDVRRLLDDKTLTALVIAAPDHWHALATIWACQAGKHVYVEKPISHNLIEGRRMVEAARKYDRVVQVGTQRRTASFVKSAAEYIRAGKLGKVPFARTWIAGSRPNIGRKPDGPVPAGVDYDLWLGPAPARPFNPNRFHYQWHWFWDYGTGELGNNGIHGLDLIRAVLDLDAPERVTCGGGKFFYDDDQQTPDTQIATFEFPKTCVVWEQRIWAKTGNEGQGWGVAIHGEKGVMLFNDRSWRIVDGPEASDKSPDLEKPHLGSFLDCIKTGGRPSADVEEGHKSTRLCHLGNIALRTGHALRFDATTETCLDDPEANRLLGRTYRPPFTLPSKI